MAKSFLDELMGYRVKVARDGKEIVNVPGILALPAALVVPRMSIIGTVAASLLGYSIHLENDDGKTVDVGKAVKDAAETVADTARTAARTVKEEIDRAWDSVSADDPEGCPVGEENEPCEDAVENRAEEIVGELEKHEGKDIPTINVDDPTKPE